MAFLTKQCPSKKIFTKMIYNTYRKQKYILIDLDLYFRMKLYKLKIIIGKPALFLDLI